MSANGAEVVKKELMFEQLVCRLLRGVELMTTIVLLGGLYENRKFYRAFLLSGSEVGN